MSNKEQPAFPDWISVEDELPETNEKFGESEYLLGWDEDHVCHVICWYNSKEKSWRSAWYEASSMPIKITHYMELPKYPNL